MKMIRFLILVWICGLDGTEGAANSLPRSTAIHVNGKLFGVQCPKLRPWRSFLVIGNSDHFLRIHEALFARFVVWRLYRARLSQEHLETVKAADSIRSTIERSIATNA